MAIDGDGGISAVWGTSNASGEVGKIENSRWRNCKIIAKHVQLKYVNFPQENNTVDSLFSGVTLGTCRSVPD